MRSLPCSRANSRNSARHLRADDVQAEILGAGVAATVAVEARARRAEHGCQRAAKHVAIAGRPSAPILRKAEDDSQ